MDKHKAGRWRAALLAGSIVAGVGVAAPSLASPQTPTPAGEQVTRATVAQSNSILRLYRAYFLRDPDRAGLAHWVNQYSSGKMSLAAISDFFSESREFDERYGDLSNAEFVRLVYLNVLGRLPDAKGESHWADLLDKGALRGAVMIGFSESPEFQRSTGTLPPDPQQPDPQQPGPEKYITDMIEQVNVERAKNGLPPLTHCNALTKAAQGHSADQARQNRSSHQGTDGSHGDSRIQRAGYHWSQWAENVAFGFTDTKQILVAWMNSPTHRTNLLNTSLVHVGVGRASAADGTVYWTLDFGAGGRC